MILSFLTLALTGQLWKKEKVGKSSYFTLQNSKSSKFLTADGNNFKTQGINQVNEELILR